MEGCDNCGRSSYMHKRAGSRYEEETKTVFHLFLRNNQ